MSRLYHGSLSFTWAAVLTLGSKLPAPIQRPYTGKPDPKSHVAGLFSTTSACFTHCKGKNLDLGQDVYGNFEGFFCHWFGKCRTNGKNPSIFQQYNVTRHVIRSTHKYRCCVCHGNSATSPILEFCNAHRYSVRSVCPDNKRIASLHTIPRIRKRTLC
ncbi:hypothetical protein DFH07DRAFT_577467 [Mycena maculata]|uniref:Secreted protein n=1 Tax=Mycena maculata TaxID=230809 RepID=A0AAD7IQH7_9AGAR|nr:hypothetical protein DFH07DRAFT_577467 [Mycena maculata]